MMGMNQIDTNVYVIENLEELSCKYKIYQIKGIPPESKDYDKNIQYLVSKLTNITKSPCESYKTDEGTFIAQPDGYPDFPESYELVRVRAEIIKQNEIGEIHFHSLNDVTKKLVVRFLQGVIQTKFYNHPSLWQPRSGYPFYNKTPDRKFQILSKNIDMYRGFSVRVILLPKKKIGVCVDVTNKYLSRYPLPSKISRANFQLYKNIKTVYEFGKRWYEIRISDMNDLNASEVKIPPDNISLFDYVHQKAGSKKSHNLLTLPPDCSVVIYYDSWNNPRNVPSGLCKRTYGTNHPQIKKLHRETIKPPYIKKNEIQFVMDRYFQDISFVNKQIKFSKNPFSVNENRFIIPDIEFGNNKVLSVRNSKDSTNVTLKEFPKKKRDMFYSDEAGIFVRKNFDRQYLIMPRSIYDSVGDKLEEDIKQGVNELFSPKDKITYSPTVIPYDDAVQKSVYVIGNSIINAVSTNDAKDGFGVVMIPRIRTGRYRKEDELGNLVMRKLRKRGIFVSIIHTDTVKNSFDENTDGTWSLVSDRRQRGRYHGYMRNVILNKILIMNSFWPFVLKTPLNADLTIGIDVKGNVAGFTLIYRNGADIYFEHSETRDKERLNSGHVCKKLIEIISKEQKSFQRDLREIVIHRQGKMFPSERKGILLALEKLANRDLISSDYNYSLVEVRSSSRVPFRFFKTEIAPGSLKEYTYNVITGTYTLLSENESFMCTTGPPYYRDGTNNPLHIYKVEGHMPFEKILEDIFYLSNLTWTRIDDCSRQPLSIKMNDIRLKELAGEFDEDALEFAEEV